MPYVFNPFTNQLDVAQAGAGAPPSGDVGKDTSTVTYSNSVAESTLFSMVVPGGTMSATSRLMVVVLGTYTKNAPGSLTLRAKFGATTLMTAVLTLTNSATAGAWRAEFDVFNASSASSQKSGGDVRGSLADGTLAWSSNLYGTAAENTASDKTFALTAQWGAASTSLIVTKQAAHVEVR